MSKIIRICAILILLRFSSFGHVLAQKEPVTTLPKPPHCGMPLSDRLSRSLETKIAEFPWTALIQYRKSNGKTGFHCGGSLINSRYVLTAAHCVQAIPSSWEVIGVRLGEWDLIKEQDCMLDSYCVDAPVDMGIEKIIVHEDYANNKSNYNDIALIRFNRSVDMSDSISPVCLPFEEPQRSQNKVGLMGYAAGWSRKMELDPRRYVKLKVQLEITDLESCANKYSRSGLVLKDTQICAKGITDACGSNVFSGGSPFTIQEHVYNYLYGFSSMGPASCTSEEIPEVFVNVAKYVDWIESKME